ncbi:MAG: cytochrome-c oxidase, cbb3-type subunit III [Hyphomicrobiales bacterium]|nr:cytochrome-c oxidase, cbb3-type subunit III [Hyphomicrobiales bacterium]MDE2016411.1 cytochrome-c oxidase, cbb3-type subunit III [Hyphomicrobiales bacterium]
MDAKHPVEIDEFTGVATTGHEWDGIKELNNPLPRWWLWTFYASIAFATVYVVLYPAIPLVRGATPGLLGWHSREAVSQDLAALDATRGGEMEKLAATPLAAIESDPKLLSFARDAGRAAFADDCAPCHGAGGQGSIGYPNLNANRWLWGGKVDQIYATIEHGARSGDPKGHQGLMPAFGRDGILDDAKISHVADYVRSLAGFPAAKGADVADGLKVFQANCVVCHGADGKGNVQVGSANLTTKVWLYGPTKEDIVKGVWGGHGGVMPYWSGRLSEPTIRALAVYVHTLGGGQ